MNKSSTFSKKLWKLGIKDFNTKFFDFNKEGDLIVKEGNNIYNVKYLAEKFGTPLEIVFPFVLEERVEDFLDLTTSLIKKLKSPQAIQLMSLADTLVKKSVWIVGGDGWAYDIGFGGLDHVMAAGRNVNILVFSASSNTPGALMHSKPTDLAIFLGSKLSINNNFDFSCKHNSIASLSPEPMILFNFSTSFLYSLYNI